MALADYTAPRAAVLSNGKPLMEVRGLSLEDVAMLVRVHMEDLQRLYDMVQNQRLGASDLLGLTAQEDFIIKLLTDLPILAGQIIALAADEPSFGETARRLPIGTQAAALVEILRLTSEDIGGPKALAALVVRMLSQVADRPTIQ